MESEDILDHEDAPIAPAEMEFTPVHFEKARAAMGELLPAIERRGADSKVQRLVLVHQRRISRAW